MYVKHLTWRSSKHGGHASSILFSLQWLPEHPTNVGVVAMTPAKWTAAHTPPFHPHLIPIQVTYSGMNVPLQI